MWQTVDVGTNSVGRVQSILVPEARLVDMGVSFLRLDPPKMALAFPVKITTRGAPSNKDTPIYLAELFHDSQT